MSVAPHQHVGNREICHALQNSSHCAAADLDHAMQLAELEGGRLDRVLLRLGLLEEAVILRAVCEASGLAYYDDLTDLAPDAKATANLTPAYLAAHLIAPVLDQDGTTLFIMSDPGNTAIVQEMAFVLGASVRVAGSPASAVRRFLGAVSDRSADENEARLSRDQTALKEAGAEGPVIRYVQEKLADAVHLGASDVHFECTETGMTIRYRINGILTAQATDSRIPVASVIARLKVMAELNVAERRLPQDGRFSVMIAGRAVDFRFSSLPTQWGESIVARVLDPRALRLGLDQLGLPSDIAGQVRALVERPSGLFLVTGPTGSGKTTTLYAALNHLNTVGRKIVTVEDPVEYNLPGMVQVQVNEGIGLSFARVLRGILRHDPNVILVGEIRDQETAEIACRAAQVGRMVLSTLHTNSAAGAVTRLTDLGVPEFIVNDVLRGVLSQTLTPVTCKECGGAGCKACGSSGATGRELRCELLVG